MNEPTHLDLFSGIGGFSLAFEAEGFRTIGFAEIDPYASAVLKKHWPNVRNYGDVRNAIGVRADLVTGGFPCQPFSVAGKRAGASDDRHLWPAMLAVIKASGAAWVVGENVAGIINMELDHCISDLESLGYACRPFVVPACAVGAKHRRDRVWILAHTGQPGLHERWKPSNAERENGIAEGVVRHGLSQRNGTEGETLADSNQAGRREQRGAESVASKYPPPSMLL